jgi:hypothetical protein
MRREATVVDPAPPISNQLAELTAEHEALEARLRELDRFVYLTPDEQLERKRIQKLKLQKKDQIQALRMP